MSMVTQFCAHAPPEEEKEGRCLAPPPLSLPAAFNTSQQTGCCWWGWGSPASTENPLENTTVGITLRRGHPSFCLGQGHLGPGCQGHMDLEPRGALEH